MKTICENENLKKNIEELKANGYKYVVKAKDNWLSGWGVSGRGGHVHIIACRTFEELETIKRDLYNDTSMSYVDWNYISNYKNIYGWTRGKSFTIRNDWTRAFSNEKEIKAYMEGVNA